MDSFEVDSRSIEYEKRSVKPTNILIQDNLDFIEEYCAYNPKQKAFVRNLGSFFCIFQTV